MIEHRSALAWGCLLLLGAVGCDVFSKSKSAEPATTPSASAAISRPGAAPGPAALPSASAAAAELPSFPSRTVPAGKAVNGSWVPEFQVERTAGNEGLTLELAAAACRDQAKDLCTETQWTRACGADTALGALETWTLSIEADAGVVRGGAAGCPARKVVPAAESAPTRAAVCCSRGVAISTNNDNEAFLLTSAKRLLDYERATRTRDASALRGLLDEAVVFAGKEQTRDALVASFEGQPPASFSAFDRCEVSIDKDGADSRLVSDCRTTTFANGAFGSTLVRVVHGGPETRVLLVGAPDTMSLLGREKKQRVRAFIGAD